MPAAQPAHVHAHCCRRDDPELLRSGRVTLAARDGWQGWEEAAPFDIIHVGAAAATVPNKLVSRLLAPDLRRVANHRVSLWAQPGCNGMRVK
jgi:Protein-L-isoaspartate(D-aspartate) O-methyltransferase (PCMT)